MVLQCQVIWVEPALPTIDAPAVVYFNANECNCPLETYDGDVYAHTGILRQGIIPWQNVIGGWGENDLQPKLRHVEERTYALDITPSIRSFYSVPGGPPVTKMAFVFRSEDASLQTVDLFIDVFKEGAVNIISPGPDNIFSIGEGIHLEAVAIGADSLIISIDGQVVDAIAGSKVDGNYIVSKPGHGELAIRAKTAQREITSTLSYFVRKQNAVRAIPYPNAQYGATYIQENEEVLLVLRAPQKAHVFVIGGFNDWNISDEYQLNVTEEGNTYWIVLDSLEADKKYAYQYIVDGDLRIADPYAYEVLDPDHDHHISSATYPDLLDYPSGKAKGIVSVFNTVSEDYVWKVEDFSKPEKQDLVIYELLVRDFIEDHTFRTIIDSMDYLASIGINAVELMPVMEFEGNSSWGYNTSFHFALDKYYGTSDDLKALVDACHERGIAVILDLVINHAYGQNPLLQMYWDKDAEGGARPSDDSPWFNTISPNQVFSFGYDFDHESHETRKYFKDVLTYWMEEFKIDGYRLDFTKGLTNRPGDGSHYDFGRVLILRDYADHVWSLNPDAYVILEHFGPNREEIELSASGMMLWGNHNHNFNQTAMGYNNGSDFSGISYKARNWDAANLVGYMESHDEERMLYKTQKFGNSSEEYNIKDLETGLARAKMAATLFFSVPGPKLIWMFGEMGYDVSIDDPCRVCEKPIRWNYLADVHRSSLKDHYAEMIHLRDSFDIFRTDDFIVDVGGPIKKVVLHKEDQSAVVVANTSVIERNELIDLGEEGEWFEYFSQRQVTSTTGTLSTKFQPGEYRLYTRQPLGPIKERKSVFLVYPSPGKAHTLIDSKSLINDLKVYDVSGRLIFSLDDPFHQYQLKTSTWSSGIYFIHAIDEMGNTHVSQFVKSE